MSPAIERLGGTEIATEWSGGIGGSIINLEGLPGSTSSFAASINNAGHVVGVSVFPHTVRHATEWSGGIGGGVIDLGGLPSSMSSAALSINDAGHVVAVDISTMETTLVLDDPFAGMEPWEGDVYLTPDGQIRR
jgi:uncharacterized membrane protein